jgi:hypothetical protein
LIEGDPSFEVAVMLHGSGGSPADAGNATAAGRVRECDPRGMRGAGGNPGAAGSAAGDGAGVGGGMIARLTHVGIGVSDLERSLRFYRDLLGFRWEHALDVEGEPSDTLLRLKGRSSCGIPHARRCADRAPLLREPAGARRGPSGR